MSDYWSRKRQEQKFIEKFEDAPRVITSECWARVEYHARRVRKRMNRLRDKGKEIGPGNCIWDLGYAFSNLLHVSRFDLLARPFFGEVQEFFAPQNAKERNTVHHFAFKLFCDALGGRQNFFDDDWSDGECVERIESAREMLHSGGWKRLSIGPKSTPLLHAMRRRVVAPRELSVN